MINLKVFRLDRKDVTSEIFAQIVAVEKSGEDGYTEDQLKELWIDDKKNDNFVAVTDDKIVGHITFNPMSKRRNGSVYMVNLMVLPECRRQGVAQQLIDTACSYYIAQGKNVIMSIYVLKCF